MPFLSGPLLLTLCSLLAAEAPPAPRPNIVLILADDMGHGHVGCLNPRSKIPTPRIDALARSGMLFTDAHSGSSVCSPTRYGLLTGRYAWRTRLKSGVLGPYDPPLIEADRITLPGLLRSHGYFTACVGKWHLGWDWPRQGQGDPDFQQEIASGPTTRGFELYFGTDVPNYPPYCFLENTRTVGLPTERRTIQNLDGRPGPMLPGWKFDAILPALVKRAEAVIDERARAKRPFFLYVPLTSPHEPIAPSSKFQGKSGLNALADFVMETDAAVGGIVDAVDRAGIAENTLVIFTADNGSSLYTGGRELKTKGHEPSAGWRGAKSSIYEGGHRVPFIARWPGRVPSGATSNRLLCLTDCLATCANLIGVPTPVSAIDSENQLPILLGDAKATERGAVVHQSAAGRLAIRQGPWKLILPGALIQRNLQANPKAQDPEPTSRELYHLIDDPAETKNVIKDHPDFEKILAAKFAEIKALH